MLTTRRSATTGTAAASIAAVTALFGIAAGVLPAYPARAAADDKPAAKKDAKPPAEDPEIKMGREAHEEMLRSGLKLVRDPKLVERVERIGKKLAETANANPVATQGYGSDKFVPYDYKFFVVDDPDVNAFCLPGGYIYVNKGLLNYVQSDDELAGVLGHEITHAAHHHVIALQKQQSKLNLGMAAGLLAAIVAKVPTADTVNLLTGFQLIALQKVNGYGQRAEQDADHGGIIISQKAGYNPVGMLTFMERLARDQKMRPDIDMGIFRTHPPEKERADDMVAQITQMGLPIKRREVTNQLKVAVRSVTATKEGPAPAGAPAAGDGLSEVLLDGKVLYRTASADRAKQFATNLDHILDTDIQMYEISRQGPTLLIRGEPILSVAPDDVKVAATAEGATAFTTTGTPDAVAEQTYNALRSALFKQFIQTAY